MIRLIRKSISRFTLVLGGEFLQSAFGFALNITLARTLTAEHYGVFAIVLLIGGFGIMYMRALIGVPACTYIPQSRRKAVARAYAVTFGSGALAIAVLGAIFVTIALSIWMPEWAVAGGTFVGSWSLRSYIRLALFAQNRPGLSTTSDLVYAVCASILCIPLVLYGSKYAEIDVVFWILSISNFVGIVIALILLRQPVRISFRRSIRRRFQKLLPSMSWSIVSVTLANLQGQGAVLLLAIITGPAGYAPIAATMAFFSPLRLAASALANVTQPDLASTYAQPGMAGSLRPLILPSAVIVTICLGYGAVMAAAFPYLAQHAFGGRFAEAPLNLIAFNIWCIATIAAIYSVPRLLIETFQQFQYVALASLIGAAIGMPLVVEILSLTSPAQALTGVLVSETIVLIGCLIFALKILRKQRAIKATQSIKSKGLIDIYNPSALREAGLRKKIGADL